MISKDYVALTIAKKVATINNKNYRSKQPTTNQAESMVTALFKRRTKSLAVQEAIITAQHPYLGSIPSNSEETVRNIGSI